MTKESATSTPGSTEPTQPGTTTPGGVTIAALALGSGVTVTAQDEVALPMECPVNPTGCNADGALTIDAQAVSTANFRAYAASQHVLGTFAGAQIATGQSQLVSVSLDPQTITTLRQRGVRRVRVTLTINDHLTAGPVATTTEHVWLNIAPLPGACPAPTGSLNGTQLGPIRLGQTRATTQRELPRYNRTRNGFDNFCLNGGWGIRVAYGTPKRSRHHQSLDGRVVLALTANAHYTLDGIAPHTALSAAARLSLDHRVHLGTTDWYFVRLGSVTGVLKVRDGIIQEVGIAVRNLTATPTAQRQFVRSFG